MKLPGVAREAPPPPLVVDADAVDDAAGAAWPDVALPAPAPASGVASAAAAPAEVAAADALVGDAASSGPCDVMQTRQKRAAQNGLHVSPTSTGVQAKDEEAKAAPLVPLLTLGELHQTIRNRHQGSRKGTKTITTLLEDTLNPH